MRLMKRMGGGWLGLALVVATPTGIAMMPGTAEAQWEPRYNDEMIFSDLTRRAEAFVQNMIRNDNISMRREMSPEARATLTSTVIDRMYATLLRSGGRVREVGTSVILNADQLVGLDYDEDRPVVVDVPLHLSRNSVTARITFERKTPLAPITAFQLIPYEGETAADGRGYTRAEQFSRPPVYANRNFFRETEAMIQAENLGLPARISIPSIAGENSRVPGVVLVAGAEPSDLDMARDTTAPFRDIAQGLATRGIAVLRYTNRSQIEGTSNENIVPTTNNVIVRDAIAAVEALRNVPHVDPNRIAIVGYGVGGTLAPLIAAEAGAQHVFMLNPPAQPIDDHVRRWVLAQQDSWGRLGHDDWEIVDAMLDAEDQLTAAQLAAAKPLIHQPPVFWQDLRRIDLRDSIAELQASITVIMSEDNPVVTASDRDAWTAKMARPSRLGPTNLRVVPGVDARFVPVESEPGRKNVAENIVEDIEMMILRGRLSASTAYSQATE